MDKDNRINDYLYIIIKVISIVSLLLVLYDIGSSIITIYNTRINLKALILES